jgi:anti-anti-sigma regulatory factor
MIQNGATVVKQLPECREKWQRRQFLSEIRQLAHESYRPQLIIDLTSENIARETLDLLLKCVEQIESSEGRVSVAGASPEAAVIFELTRLSSVMNVFPSLSEAIGIEGSQPLEFPGSTDANRMVA